MKAFILAGGQGVRMYPYTMVLPKPLVPIGEVPILEILLNQLARTGFTDVVLSVGYLESLIRAYFQPERVPIGMTLTYVQEPQPLGTAGSLSMLQPPPEEPLLVLNGDILTDMDFRRLMVYHEHSDAALTIASSERAVQIDMGVIGADNAGRIRSYKEKPRLNYSVSMGIYVYDPCVFSYIPQNEHLDFPDLVVKLIEAGEVVQAYRSDNLWLDIGSPRDHVRANEVFAADPARFLSGSISPNGSNGRKS